MCNNNTFFYCLCSALMEKHDFFLPSLETVPDTVQYRYCIFSLLYRLLRIRLKRHNPLLSYVRDSERVHCKCTVYCTVYCTVHCKCTMYCTVHFIIIILFNVGNVLLCVIYQLNVTVFMYVTGISRYITLYIAFGIIWGFT
jgi:hypothetical protein